MDTEWGINTLAVPTFISEKKSPIYQRQCGISWGGKMKIMYLIYRFVIHSCHNPQGYLYSTTNFPPFLSKNPASEPPCLHAAGFLSAEPNLPGNGSFDGRVARTLPGASEARAALRTRARALQKCIKSCSENRAAWRGPTPFHAQGVGDDGATRQSPFSGWSSGTWTGHASGRR